MSGEKLKNNMDNKEKRDFILKLIIAINSVLTFLIILIAVIVLVPKTVRLMNSAQRTIDNMETVSEELNFLFLFVAVKMIEDNTSQAMSDVSGAMEQIEKLDVDTLNQSIQDLKESVEKFSNLFGK